jgi:1-pyrroline-5-carboxylate dehydrogenase
MLAATMLGQGKNVWQAEIDAAVEAIDFWRFGPEYVQQIYSMQPPETDNYIWNRMEYRALEGFILAICPFNFLAIGTNLPSSPAMVGNTVLWKPSTTATYSNYLGYKILEEAGMPAGVMNFLPGHGADVSDVAFADEQFAGLHFTGSTATFNKLWKTVAGNLDNYLAYPRIVGETGGKNFHFVHKSADVESVVNNSIRSAFEYSGQKCSACSRAYIPDSMWMKFKEVGFLCVL